MIFMIKIIIFISYLIIIGSHFSLWRSKKNIIVIQELPMYIIAYMGGIIFLFDEAYYQYNISKDNLIDLAVVMLVGSIIYCFGFLLGYFGRFSIKDYLRSLIVQIYNKNPSELVSYKLRWVHFVIFLTIVVKHICPFK